MFFVREANKCQKFICQTFIKNVQETFILKAKRMAHLFQKGVYGRRISLLEALRLEDNALRRKLTEVDVRRQVGECVLWSQGKVNSLFIPTLNNL